MKISLTPQYIECKGYWDDKAYSVILVEKEEDIEPLYKLLCEQDEYWEHPDYKEIIKVAPKKVENKRDLMILCEWAGKIDIYDVPALKEKIDFFIFQYKEETNYVF